MNFWKLFAIFFCLTTLSIQIHAGDPEETESFIKDTLPSLFTLQYRLHVAKMLALHTAFQNKTRIEQWLGIINKDFFLLTTKLASEHEIKICDESKVVTATIINRENNAYKIFSSLEKIQPIVACLIPIFESIDSAIRSCAVNIEALNRILKSNSKPSTKTTPSYIRITSKSMQNLCINAIELIICKEKLKRAPGVFKEHENDLQTFLEPTLLLMEFTIQQSQDKIDLYKNHLNECPQDCYARVLKNVYGNSINRCQSSLNTCSCEECFDILKNIISDLDLLQNTYLAKDVEILILLELYKYQGEACLDYFSFQSTADSNLDIILNNITINLNNLLEKRLTSIIPRGTSSRISSNHQLLLEEFYTLLNHYERNCFLIASKLGLDLSLETSAIDSKNKIGFTLFTALQRILHTKGFLLPIIEAVKTKLDPEKITRRTTTTGATSSSNQQSIEEYSIKDQKALEAILDSLTKLTLETQQALQKLRTSPFKSSRKGKGKKINYSALSQRKLIKIKKDFDDTLVFINISSKGTETFGALISQIKKLINEATKTINSITNIQTETSTSISTSLASQKKRRMSKPREKSSIEEAQKPKQTNSQKITKAKEKPEDGKPGSELIENITVDENPNTETLATLQLNPFNEDEENSDTWTPFSGRTFDLIPTIEAIRHEHLAELSS